MTHSIVKRVEELERLVDYILVELIRNPSTSNENLTYQLKKFREDSHD